MGRKQPLSGRIHITAQLGSLAVLAFSPSQTRQSTQSFAMRQLKVGGEGAAQETHVPEPRQYTVADLKRARDRVAAAERLGLCWERSLGPQLQAYCCTTLSDLLGR